MLMTKQRRPPIRTLRGWAINVLNEAGAIRECDEHGWMQDRANPHDESGPSTSPVEIRQQTYPVKKRRPRFATCWIRLVTPAQNALLTRRTGARPRRRPYSASAAQLFLHALARVANLFDGLLHRWRRPSGLLCFVLQFVVLPACHPRPVLLPSTGRLALLRSRHWCLLL